ncbi:hypothetical protein, partial [Cronobacter sakazakii]
EEQLHNQEQPTYGIGYRGQSAQNTWVYSGLYYADKVYGNKYMRYIQLLAFLLGAALNASASEIKEIFNRQQPLTIEGVTITPQRELSSLYSDEKLHTVGNRQYFLLINGFPHVRGISQHNAVSGRKCMLIFTRLKIKKRPGYNV